MKVSSSTKFTIKPVVAALSLLAAASVVAAPTPNQLPGGGTVTAVSLGSAGTNFGGVGAPIVNLSSVATNNGIGIDGKVVITWGGTGAPADATNPLGFNIGSSGKLQFGAISAGSAVLNIDASGNASQIFGTLESTALPFVNCGACAFAPAMFVANGNGIVVGSSGRIAAPTGVGLIGANLNNATAKADFVANNGWTGVPALGTSFIDVTTGQSTVTVNGAINGSLTVNAPAGYILLAGGDIVNTGNNFSNQFWAYAGLRASPQTDTVNGVAGTTVNRLWNVTTGSAAAGLILSTLPIGIEIASAASTFVNTGSISSPTSSNLVIGAAASIRTGTAGDTNVLTGIFSDGVVILDTYVGAAGKIEVYNTISGYTTNKSLQALGINYYSAGFSGTEGEVIVNALTPGSQPSSIATVQEAYIFGTDVTVNSTINHKLTSAGGINTGDNELVIQGSKSVTITADVGASGNVVIGAQGSGGVTISGNVISDTDKNFVGAIDIESGAAAAPLLISGNLTSYGENIFVEGNGPMTISGNIVATDDDVYVYNVGTASGNTTTISGNITAYDFLDVENQGALSSNLNITGTLLSTDGYIHVMSNGNLQLAKVTSDNYSVDIDVYGLSSMLNGAVTADDYVDFYAPAAVAKAKPAAVITAPTVYVQALNFQGVNASGAAYANVGEKPSAQIVTNSLVLYMYGSFNAPIAGNTNWLTNQIQVEALDPLSQVNVTISAMGAGFQAINIGVTGNASVNSGDTYTPFNAVGLTTGTTTAGGLIGNGGSQLIVNASGNLDIWDGFTTAFFEFPGGIAFKAGGVLTQFVPVYNAWTLEALPYQGVFFEAPTINALSYIATNGNSWANWSVKPVAGAPTVYQITQPAPTTFGFVANAAAAYLNTYSLLITGTPVNTCPGFPPVCN